MKKDYIDIAKDFIDNYVFCSHSKDFYSVNVIDYEGNFLEELESTVCDRGDFLYKLLESDFYRIQDTDVTFHRRDLYDFLRKYKRVRRLSFEDAMKSNKKVILEMNLHPCSLNTYPFESLKKDFFDDVFKDIDVLNRMKKGDLFILLYYGYESDSFSISPHELSDDKFKCHYDMFQTVLREYGLPSNSLVIINGNQLGYEQEKEYDFTDTFVNVIFTNAMECDSFKRTNKEIDKYDYSFEEYIENINTAEKVILRTNRTSGPTRDQMLYFLYKNDLIKYSLIEHNEFQENDIMREFEHPYNYPELKLKVDGGKYNLKVINKIINQIKSDLPYTASDYERNHTTSTGGHFSDKPIPFDIYKKTIFSWVSLSLSTQWNKVLISPSTFNPILHYHPIIWNGNIHTIKCFNKFGYKSYSWLFDESVVDNIEDGIETTLLNIKEIIRVMKMSRDELVGIIKNNRDTLEHNRKMLFECRSIEDVIRKFYSIVEGTNE